MADPLSVSASIAGIVSIADIVVEHLIKYIREVKDARKEVSALLRETSSLGGILKALSHLAKELESDRFGGELQTHHIHSCAMVLLRLRALLDANDASTAKKSLIAFKRTLCWPISKPESESILVELERHKSTLSLALEADSFDALIRACSRQEVAITNGFGKMEAGLNQIRKRFDVAERFFLDENRRKILNFFSTVDPKKYQKAGLELLHPGTGLWFTDGEDFRSWCNTPNAKLWITGIPGAGKTILMARIIETLQRNPSADDGLAYFYCDYRDTATHDIVNLLRSLLKQFALQHKAAFDQLQVFYEQKSQEGAQLATLTVNELCNLILMLTANFDNALILVDGLDECTGDQILLLETLQSLIRPQENNIKLLYASRDEHDIRSHVNQSIEFSIAAKSADLKLYVLAEMEKRTTLGRLNVRRPALKEQIMVRLVEKAQGMFRWVVCQLDYLCELNSDKERREALDSLPPNLTLTYKRILTRVNDRGTKVQNLVRKSLLWLAYAKSSAFSCTEALMEALSMESDTEELDPDNIIDLQAVLRFCGSLVRRSQNGFELELAHFTVKEFLIDISPQDHSYAQYRLDQTMAGKEIAETSLRYLNLAKFMVPYPQCEVDIEKVVTESPFLLDAAISWVHYARRNSKDNTILALVHKLFGPAKSESFMNWALAFGAHRLIRYDDHPVHLGDLSKFVAQASVLHWAALLALSEVTQWLLDSGVRTEQATFLGYPIHCAAGAGLSGAFSMLGDTCLEGVEACINCEDQVRVIKLLVQHGANVKLSRMGYATPIQLACHSDHNNNNVDWPATSALLKAGVAVDRDFWTLRSYRGDETATINDDSKRQLLNKISTNAYEILDKEWFLDTAMRLKPSCPFGDWQLPDQTQAISAQLKQQSRLFCYAIENRQADKVAALISNNWSLLNIDVQGLNVLMDVVVNDLLEIMHILLEHGANLKVQDTDCGTLLHYAAQGASRELVNLLVRKDLDIEAVNNYGETPLMIAARYNNVSALEEILTITEERQLQLRQRSMNGQTLLHFVALGGSYEIFRRLNSVYGGDNIHSLDERGFSCLDMAVEAQSSPVVEFLISRGLRASELRQDHSTTLGTAILLMDGSSGSEIVRMLLDRGEASATTILNDGMTPLHLVATSNAYWLHKNDLVKLLLQNGASVSARDCTGSTPLELLCKAVTQSSAIPFASIFETLILHSTDVNVDYSDDNSALQTIGRKWIECYKSSAEDSKNSRAVFLSGLLKLLERSSIDSVIKAAQNGVDIWGQALRMKETSILESIIIALEQLPKKQINTSHFGLINACCNYGCSLQAFNRIIPYFDADVFKHDQSAIHAIDRAVRFGHVELVSRLLDLGYDVEGRWRDWTPLMTAAWSGKLPMIELLIQRHA